MFDIKKVDIKELLKWINSGKLQLPEFQRDFVWPDLESKRLIASVANNFPVGALLTLETGGTVAFHPRLLEGAPRSKTAAQYLLLDGQQRMTSLFMAMYTDSPVLTQSGSSKIKKRFYFIDIEMAMDPTKSFEDFIISVPENKRMRSYKEVSPGPNLSDEGAQFEWHLFPLNRIFKFSKWYAKYTAYWKAKEEEHHIERLDQFQDSIIEVISRYEMPIIEISKDSTREAICLVFEKVNVGGTKLGAFELLTAIYAAEKFRLRDRWFGNEERSIVGKCVEITGPKRLDVMSKVKPIEFLQTCAFIHTYKEREIQVRKGVADRKLPKVSCTRPTILGLSCSDYKKCEGKALEGFLEAGRFLSDREITLSSNMPYPVLIVGLAATFALLKKAKRDAPGKKKIAQWFWTAAFSQLLKSASDSRLARDIPDLIGWIESDAAAPSTVNEGQFYAGTLDQLKDRTKDVFKAVYALLLQQGCRDFINGDKVTTMNHADEAVDVHHIFPKAWCQKMGFKLSEYDSIVNKTPLSATTNRKISGSAPSVYLKQIETDHTMNSSDLDEILKSHLIDPSHLRSDNFKGFLNDRKNALCKIIEEAMGKGVLMADAPGED